MGPHTYTGGGGRSQGSAMEAKSKPSSASHFKETKALRGGGEWGILACPPPRHRLVSP